MWTQSRLMVERLLTPFMGMPLIAMNTLRSSATAKYTVDQHTESTVTVSGYIDLVSNDS